MKASDLLSFAGWKVINIWECDLKSKVREKTLDNLLITLKKLS